jgi:hypothetical protein
MGAEKDVEPIAPDLRDELPFESRQVASLCRTLVIGLLRQCKGRAMRQVMAIQQGRVRYPPPFSVQQSQRRKGTCIGYIKNAISRVKNKEYASYMGSPDNP